MNNYRESIYNLKYENNGRVVVFNFKTGGVVVPDKQDTENFKNVLSNPKKFDKDDTMLKQLVDYKFVVDSDEDEIGNIKELHELAIEEAKQHIGYVIVPTEYCNFACPYCFIYSYDRPPMSQEVFDGIYNSFILKIEENKKKELELKEKAKEEGKTEEEIEKIIIPTRVDVSWFGGEPTCAADSIIKFMDRVLELEKNYTNVHVGSTMITNGYLLNFDLLKKFVDRKITFFQITLDGNKQTHDQTRYLRGNKGPTFDTIYKNLLEIKEKSTPEMNFNISIRSNFLNSNIDSMLELKDMLKKDFEDDKRFSNYFHQVYQAENDTGEIAEKIFGEKDGLDTACQLNNSYDIEKLKLSQIEHLYSVLPRPKFHPCFSTNNTYCVTVKGALFACESMVGEDSKAVGKLNQDGTMEFYDKMFKKWKDSMFNNLTQYKNCIDCKLLPVCIGGCKYNKIEVLMEGCLATEDTVMEKLKNYLDVYLLKEHEPKHEEKCNTCQTCNECN
ncbi:MAG: SPASM domain-containing protein [Fusobacteria bacterium]|nr:SPASM domain-containing protein [Fusobacteriota bacterium]